MIPTQVDVGPVTDRQAEVIQADDADLLVEGAPRSAKSWAIAVKIHLLAQRHEGIQIFYSRYKDESLGQLRDVWTKVMALFPEFSRPTWNSSDSAWDYPNPADAPPGMHWGSKVWLSSIKSSETDLLHSKYKGKTLAVIVVEEASELPYANYVGLQERLSQSKHPSGRPYDYPLQFILVTNALPKTHWIAKLYPQKGKDPVTGRRTIRFALRDNAINLGEKVLAEYERRYPEGHSLRRTVVEGERGLVMMGEAVYGKVFRPSAHVSHQLRAHSAYPILEGWDFGHEKPACVWLQYLQHLGALRLLGWVKGHDLFLEAFVPAVLRIRTRTFPGVPDTEFWTWADPSGATGNQGMQHTAVRHLRDAGVTARIDPTSNQAAVRYAAIQVVAGFLERLAKDGSPAFQMVPTGIELQRVKGELVDETTDLMKEAFEAGYIWDEHAALDSLPNVKRPKKPTDYDDLMNCLEYVVIGERLSVPSHQEMWRADKKVAAITERALQSVLAERVEGPTGETLAEAEARIVRANRLHKDHDPRDRRRQESRVSGSRGGY